MVNRYMPATNHSSCVFVVVAGDAKNIITTVKNGLLNIFNT